MVVIKRVINSIFNSNTYIISKESSNDVWLVDVGDMDKIIAELQPNQLIKGVFITHSHFDHIYGLNQLVEKFPDCIIYTSKEGKEGLYNDKKNFSYYHEKPLNFRGRNVSIVEEDSKINLYDTIEMKCLYTPGHDASCISYICNNYFFTGDSYIPGEKPVTKLKGGNKMQYKKSLERIFSILNEELVLCPGHTIIK